MPVGDLGTERTRVGRVAVLATSETYVRYTIGVVERTSSSMLSCDTSATPSGPNSPGTKPGMGRPARCAEAPITLMKRDPMKRFPIVLAALALLGMACGNGNSTGVQNNPPNPNGLGPRAVNLGTAGDYVILAKSGVSTTGVTAVVGDIGLSPAAATYVTGFALSTPPTTFTTSSQVTGKVWASNYAVPTPANLTTAILNMQTAYTDAAGRTSPTATELGAGNIQGMTLVPGLYKWGTGVSIPSAVTLSGGANDVWIFQSAQNLTVSNGAIVTLSGGAQAKNVFWQVAGQATLGTTSDFKGIILSKTLIAFNTGAAITGRALAQTAVTLNATAITNP